MKLSTKVRYAITAMMDLALHENKRPVTLSDISKYQGISLSYLEQLFAKLRTKGLVKGVRGPGGGYRLARGANEISIADIVGSINDPNESIFKETRSQEEHITGERDLLEVMWTQLSDKLNNFLGNISLQDCVDGAATAREPEPPGPGGDEELSSGSSNLSGHSNEAA